MGGLKTNIKPFYKAFKHKSIADAIEIATLQEESLSAYVKPSSYTSQKTVFPYIQANKPHSNIFLCLNILKPPLLPTPKTIPLKNPIQNFPQNNGQRNYIPASVRAEKKQAKGLCYYCDQSHHSNHKCQF